MVLNMALVQLFIEKRFMADLGFSTKICSKKRLTQNVFGITLERPLDYSFSPGQSICLAIENPIEQVSTNCYALTGLSNARYLELILKIDPARGAPPHEFSMAMVGDPVSISHPFDTFTYHKPGTFIAEGVAISPFLAILRQLHADDKIEGNRLIFVNKTVKDIFLEEELAKSLGVEFIEILTQEYSPGYFYGSADADFIQYHSELNNRQFYVCGSQEFSEFIKGELLSLGVIPEKIMTALRHNGFKI